MAPWGTPDTYIQPKCEDNISRTFTERGKQNPNSDSFRGFVTVMDEKKVWHKIPGFYFPDSNTFLADRRSKWAFLIVPGMQREWIASLDIPEPEPLSDYKVESTRLGPPIIIPSTKEEIEAIGKRNEERIEAWKREHSQD